jgi:hypothetical protein
MALHLRVPLPGPFVYTKRVGGRRRRVPSCEELGMIGSFAAALLMWVPCVFLLGMPWYVPTLVACVFLAKPLAAAQRARAAAGRPGNVRDT